MDAGVRVGLIMKEVITKKKLREFGIIIGLCFPFFIGWLIPSLNGHEFRLWTICVALPFLIIGFARPQSLLFPYKLWIKLGYFLGFINIRIILGLIFFIVLLPISIFLRIIGYDPLKKKKLKKISYRETNETHKVDLTKIF